MYKTYKTQHYRIWTITVVHAAFQCRGVHVYSYGTRNSRTGKQNCLKLMFRYPCPSLVSLAFTFYDMLTFIHYVEVYFTIALLDCVHYNEDFGNSRLCSIQFTVILARLKKILRYTKDFVIYRFIKSRFHCTLMQTCLSANQSTRNILVTL